MEGRLWLQRKDWKEFGFGIISTSGLQLAESEESLNLLLKKVPLVTWEVLGR